MVVTLENYRGFQIRLHEKLEPFSLHPGFPFPDFVAGVVCVHCTEGTDATYKSLMADIGPRLPNYRIGLRIGDRYYMGCGYTGPCDEDGQMVGGVCYELSRLEDEAFAQQLIGQISDECKRTIDSLWDKAMKPDE